VCASGDTPRWECDLDVPKSQRIARELDCLNGLVNVYTCHGARGDRRKCQLLMLTAYFDESGIHEGPHLCVVAGYLGNDAQWTSLTVGYPRWGVVRTST
jgi:hypothetical protein